MLAVAGVALRRFLRERSNFFYVFVLPFSIILFIGYSSDPGGGGELGIVGSDTEIGAAVSSRLSVDDISEFGTTADALAAVGDNAVTAVVVFSPDPSDPVVFYAREGVGLDLRSKVDEAVAAESQRSAVVRQAALVGVDEDEVSVAVAEMSETPLTVERIGSAVGGGLTAMQVSALTQTVLFTFLSSLTASAMLVQDRQLGMAARKASAPISIGRLVGGETLGRFWITMVQALLIVGVTAVFFRVDWGDPVATGAVLVMFGLVATGTGILLGSALDNPEGANGMGIMIALVLAAVGGAMAPVEVFPPAMQTVARMTPHYWAIDGLETSLTGGNIGDLAQPLGILTAFAATILLASTFFYRSRTFGGR